eukprot:jgi/Psemu1/38669/gm1.38669_g
MCICSTPAIPAAGAVTKPGPNTKTGAPWIPEAGAGQASSVGTRVLNPSLDPRLMDANVVKKLGTPRLRKAIGAMKEKGLGPLSRPDGRKRCHSCVQ